MLTLPGAVWAIDEHGVTRYANAELAAVLGVGLDELTDLPAAPYLRPTRRAGTMAAVPGIAAELGAGLRTGQVWVAYQPVTDLDGRLSGVEALARWDHPERGAIPPSEFIPMAERSALIDELFDTVLRAACRDLARWRNIQPALTAAVNVSARQLSDPGVVTQIDRCLRAHDLPASALCIEVTETVVMDDPAAAVASLQNLRRLGVRIAIDDFGTGYSSLLYLRRLPAHVLKLDRFFVAELGSDERDRDIVGFMINLADSLGLDTVAEGVENGGQLQVLRDLGCTLTQGYYWSTARPATGIDSLLRDGPTLSGADWQVGRVESVPDRRSTGPRPVGHDQSTIGPDAVPAQDGDGSERRGGTDRRLGQDRRAGSDRREGVDRRMVGADGGGGVRRVLLVDDSAGQRSLQRLTLESGGGYEVVGEAETGDDALAIVARIEVDIVLLDLSMPGRSGLEVLPDLVAGAGGAQVVVCSGYVSPAMAETARGLGAAACLDKALSADQLLAALADLQRPAVPAGARRE